MKLNPYRVGLAVAAVTAIAAGTYAAIVEKADAAEPYGGCDEAGQSALTVNSDGADWCRDHGWTVTRTIVIDPNGWVRATSLSACPTDEAEGGPCLWNARRQGNHRGQSFWLDRNDTVHPVTGFAVVVR